MLLYLCCPVFVCVKHSARLVQNALGIKSTYVGALFVHDTLNKKFATTREVFAYNESFSLSSIVLIRNRFVYVHMLRTYSTYMNM